jgi:predicted protein tyrosine phosphatase
VLCDRAGAGFEREIAQAMRQRAPHASPNALLVRHADDILGREGRMIEAMDAIGRGKIVTEGARVEFPLTLHMR